MSDSERRTGPVTALGDGIGDARELGDAAEVLDAVEGEGEGGEAAAAVEVEEVEEEEKQVTLTSLAGYAACSVRRRSSTWVASCTQAAWEGGQGQGGQDLIS